MRASGSRPRISVVIVTLNEDHLRSTVENLRETLPSDSEILVVDDGGADGSTDFLKGARGSLRLLRSNGLGVAKARNWGARRTRGEVLVFADAHVQTRPGWWKPLLRLLKKPPVGAVAPAICDLVDSKCRGFGLQFTGPDLEVDWLPRETEAPCPVPLLSGCFWAMRRDTFEATGGFDAGMIRWGSEDNELSVRLWLQGYEVWLAPQVEVAHLFREHHPYPVEWSWLVHNKLRLAFLHFRRERVARVVEALQQQYDFASGVALIGESDLPAQRRRLQSRRVRDDEWFFQRFGANW